MIPIRDTAPSTQYPVVTIGLIVANVLVYVVQNAQGGDTNLFVFTYGLVPARYSLESLSAYFSSFQQIFSFISYMFLHGGILHLVGNMWFLYIFGDNVEDRLGHLRYLAFYLLCGIFSGMIHLVLNFQSQYPTIGASGAVAGIMGGYFLLYPKARVLTLIPIIIIPWIIEIPAVVFLGIWFLFQVLNVAGSTQEGGGVAWWAHIGGFLVGAAGLWALKTLPSIGVSDRLRPATTKRRSHRLHMVKPTATPSALNVNGAIVVTAYESLTGTRKLISIPGGYGKRLIRVTIPSGVNEGTQLRLRGLGRADDAGRRGDLFLRVQIRESPPRNVHSKSA